MCGIAGFLLRRGGDRNVMDAACRSMTDAISARGPDGDGMWSDPDAGIWLGHRRLAVIDLSKSAEQPMVSACGRYVLSYNGEIYNHRELAARLAGVGAYFKGHGDTEVLLAAFVHWGVEKTLREVNGMFAVALWDREQRRLQLIRDRAGKKPMYWGWVDDQLVFGSTLQALTRFPGFSFDVDRDAVAAYMRYGYIPAPYSVFRGIRKLRAAHQVLIDCNGNAIEARYWRHGEKNTGSEQDSGDEVSSLERLDRLLSDAVRRRMVADVPVGAFLSGGIDSSLITALMSKVAPGKVKTYAVGFEEAAYDESAHARRIAAYLGTQHTEITLRAADAPALIEQMPEVYDEPFADPSQLPMFKVSKLAHREITVSLSGDGGDELFCGYNRYLFAARIWRHLMLLPAPVTRLSGGALAAVSPAVWRTLEGIMPAGIGYPNLADKMSKLSTVLVNGRRRYYQTVLSQWPSPEAVVLGACEPSIPGFDEVASATDGDIVDVMQRSDIETYLPDDILTKVDRASMAVSLEVRAPFLDHRIMSFAAAQSRDAMIDGGTTKVLLRQLLARYIPPEYTERPKMGFGLPIGDWLRKELRDWAEALLDPTRLRGEGVFDPGPITEAWQDHVAGRANREYRLWTVLMFQNWAAAMRARVR